MLAKLTVNEFKEASDGIRIYSVESIDIAKPAGFRASSISENRRNYNPLAGFEDKLEARIAEVNPKDGAFSIGDRAYTTVAQEIAALKKLSPPTLSGIDGNGLGNGWNRSMSMSNNALSALNQGANDGGRLYGLGGGNYRR